MASETKEKVAACEIYINDVLRESLKAIEECLMKVNQEITEYIELKHSLEHIQNEPNGPFKSQMDIGCGFHIQTKVEDVSKVLINIGLDIYLEFTIPEALKFLDNRIKKLTEHTTKLRDKSAKTKAHIKLLLVYIGQMEKF
uniref:Putative transcriptional regulator uxt n=1 Tax=Xenopsylla cheopis TaxID=163159 RepID=A0A6M2DPC9_XENCH